MIESAVELYLSPAAPWVIGLIVAFMLFAAAGTVRMAVLNSRLRSTKRSISRHLSAIEMEERNR